MSDVVAPRSRDVLVQTLIGSGHGLSHFHYLCLPPLFPLIQADYGVSYAALGLLYAAFSLSTGGFQVLAGFLVDRIGARPILIGGVAISGIAIAALGFTDSYWAMMVLVIAAGAGNSVFHPCDYVILSASVRPERIGQAFSIHTFVGNIGFALAPPTMIGCAALFGWHGALIVAGALTVPVLIGLLVYGEVLHERRVVANVEPQGKTAAKGGVQLLFSPPILMMSAFFLTLGLVSSGLQAFLVTALAAAQGLTLETASLALTGLLAASAAGVLVGGYVSDRTSRHGPFVAACLTASGLLLMSVGLLPMTGVVLVLVFAAIGLTHGMIRPSRDIMVRQITPEKDIGKVFGFVSTGLSIGGAVAPMIFGLILDYGRPEWIFWAFGLFTILCLSTLGTSRMYATPSAATRAAE